MSTASAEYPRCSTILTRTPEGPSQFEPSARKARASASTGHLLQGAELGLARESGEPSSGTASGPGALPRRQHPREQRDRSVDQEGEQQDRHDAGGDLLGEVPLIS